MDTPGNPTAPSRLAAIDLTLVAVRFLQRHATLLIPALVATPVVAVLASYLVQPQFTASATFVAEGHAGSSLPASLTGAAAALGLSVPTGETRPPQFYAQVLTGRAMVRGLLKDSFPDLGSGDDDHRVPLITILNVGEDDPARRIERAERELGKRIAVTIDPRNSGIMTLSVEAPAPRLAAEIAERLVERLNQFLLSSRRQEATQRRAFLEARMAAVQSELRAHEGVLRAFYERNRRWQDSPELVFQEATLSRQVDLSQAVYLTLAREYESARVDEANSTPIIQVIDEPVPPTRRSRPRRSQIALLGLFLGALLGATTGLVLDFWSAHAPVIRQNPKLPPDPTLGL